MGVVSGSGGVAYGRWCPKRVRGTGQAGQTSLAGWARQGRSRGSICVYRATRVTLLIYLLPEVSK